MLNVAYVTTFDPSDVLMWSGIGRNAAEAVSHENTSLWQVGPLNFSESQLCKLRRRFHRYALQQWYDPERDPQVAKHFAAQVDEFVNARSPACILSLGTIPIAFCQCSIPVAIWVDATLPALLESYPGYKNVAQATIRADRHLEQRAFDRCSLAMFASDWAAESAMNHFGLDRAKIHIVPFGANLHSIPNDAEVHHSIQMRYGSPWRLIFLGVEWGRKGGFIAWQAAHYLNQQGFPTELHVVGCDPPAELKTAPWLISHGFLRKDRPAELAKLNELISSAHFLILPARAECFGIVFAEASAFGVPSLATDVCGIPNAVRNGRNGQLFPVTAEPRDYAEFLRSSLQDWPGYCELAANARAEFRQRLDWKVIGESVRKLLRDMVAATANSARAPTPSRVRTTPGGGV
jgi:glycosyltransferase involved in cell wall biosynthesis